MPAASLGLPHPLLGLSDLDPEFLEAEDIISKLSFIEALERRWPYGPAQGRPLSVRILRALEALPPERRMYALAVFANAIYIPSIMVSESWKYLLYTITRRLKYSSNHMSDFIANEAMLFEVDFSGLVYAFFQANRLQGRLDRDKFPRLVSIDHLIEQLHALHETTNPDPKELRRNVLATFEKKYWLILTDNALSGTSVSSELERALQLAAAFGRVDNKPIIIPLVHLLTEQADDAVRKLQATNGNPDNLWDSTFSYYLDNSYRIRPAPTIDPELGSQVKSECLLFNQQSTFDKVLELCEWFASDTYFAKDPDLEATKKISLDNLGFGWKAGGWTVITPNAPTNSLPILWYSTPSSYEGPFRYEAPFPRIPSRTTQQTGGGGRYLSSILKNEHSIRSKLYPEEKLIGLRSEDQVEEV